MRMEVRAKGMSVTSAMDDYCKKRLRFALGRFGHCLGRVVVSLSDVNGPRGGEDKLCRVRVSLDGQRLVVVDSVASSMYVAIDHAVGRVGRTVNRRLRKRRSYDRPAWAGA